MEIFDNMTNLETLRTFCLAAELNSFSSCARQLEVPRATVSQRISQLEEAVGVRLFRRTTRRIELTHEGRLLYQATKSSLLTFNRAVEDIQQKHELSGQIRLSVPALMPDDLMALWLQEFSNTHPDVVIEIIASDNISDLAFDGIDIAIRGNKVTADTLVCRHWQSIPMALVTLTSTKQSISNEDPVLDPLGCYQPITQVAPDLANIRSKDILTTLRLCLLGYHRAYLPFPVVAKHLESGELKKIEGVAEESFLDIFLVYEALPLLSPAARALVSFLQQKMS